MLSRRSLIAGSAAVAALAVPGTTARAKAVLTEDGLYTQPWFLQSFLELADDLKGAADNGKRLAIMWELRGCPYCKETHLVNFAKPEIESYIKDHFEILQLNIIGSHEVTDFDGEKLLREADGGEIWRPLHPDVSVLSGKVGRIGREEAARARGDQSARLP